MRIGVGRVMVGGWSMWMRSRRAVWGLGKGLEGRGRGGFLLWVGRGEVLAGY